jgi:hypothetical protein
MIHDRHAFFSIVVPTFERPASLANCLQSLALLDYPRDRLALRGWRVTFMEHVIQTLAMLVALLTLWQSGDSNLALIVVRLQAIAIVTFILMVDRNMRPSCDARLLRLGLSLATGLLGVPTLVQALAASAGIVLWVRPKTYLASIHSKAADS